MKLFNFFARCILLHLLVLLVHANYEEKVYELNHKGREKRDCIGYGPTSVVESTKGSHKILIFLLFLLFGLLAVLLLLGLLKAILGICCFPLIGMWGLGILVDLPRPLDEYQEKDLKKYPVEYDAIGWPIHPITKERSVRALPKQSEFCLNIIFFLTYPLVVLLDLLSACLFQTYDDDSDKNRCFEGVNTIVFCNCTGKKKCYIGRTKQVPTKRAYLDENDTEEERDTQYVMNQMRKSQENILKHH